MGSFLDSTDQVKIKQTAEQSRAEQSRAEQSRAEQSRAEHTQHSTAQHSTAQHSTAQHSTAQHSTAQHSTAQHSKKYSLTTNLHQPVCKELNFEVPLAPRDLTANSYSRKFCVTLQHTPITDLQMTRPC
jgi:hypothetical protein